MTKKNILTKTRVGDKVHVTFDAHDGQRTYEYSGSAARAILRGRDPGAQQGAVLVQHVKPQTPASAPASSPNQSAASGGKRRFGPAPR